MTSKTEVRLEYQKDTGLGLNTIIGNLDNDLFYGECTECDGEVEVELDVDLVAYIHWLEEKLTEK